MFFVRAEAAAKALGLSKSNFYKRLYFGDLPAEVASRWVVAFEGKELQAYAEKHGLQYDEQLIEVEKLPNF